MTFPRLDLSPATSHRLGIPENSDIDVLQKISSGDINELWARNGYLYFPGLLKNEALDALWVDVERAWAERPNVDMCVGPNGVTATTLDTIGERPEKQYRFLNFHQFSASCLQLALHPFISNLVRLLLRGDPVLMQTLVYERSSEQSLHVDYMPVRTEIPHLMMASWIACEDVDDTTGPLVYYPGSHNIDPMEIGDSEYGEFFPMGAAMDLNAFLARECSRRGLRRQELHAKRGDVFLWHAALLHGGKPVTNYSRTRKSLVSHYSVLNAYPKCNFYAKAEREKFRDAYYYKVKS